LERDSNPRQIFIRHLLYPSELSLVCAHDRNRTGDLRVPRRSHQAELHVPFLHWRNTRHAEHAAPAGALSPNPKPSEGGGVMTRSGCERKRKNAATGCASRECAFRAPGPMCMRTSRDRVRNAHSSYIAERNGYEFPRMRAERPLLLGDLPPRLSCGSQDGDDSNLSLSAIAFRQSCVVHCAQMRIAQHGFHSPRYSWPVNTPGAGDFGVRRPAPRSNRTAGPLTVKGRTGGSRHV
jgi:hypothetical protein